RDSRPSSKLYTAHHARSTMSVGVDRHRDGPTRFRRTGGFALGGSGGSVQSNTLRSPPRVKWPRSASRSGIAGSPRCNRQRYVEGGLIRAIDSEQKRLRRPGDHEFDLAVLDAAAGNDLVQVAYRRAGEPVDEQPIVPVPEVQIVDAAVVKADD